MKSIKDQKWFKDLKEDKKKLAIVILIPIVLLISIVLGFVFNDSDDSKANQLAQTDSVIVPVDTIGKKEKVGKRETYSTSFFDETEDSKANPEFEEDQPITEAPQVKATSYRPINYGSSGSTKTEKKTIQKPEEDEPAEVETKSKRKRAPNDGFSISGTTGAGIVPKLVVDNRTRTVKSGSTVYFHAANNFVLGGISVPKNTILQGIAQLTRERVKVSITQVRIGNEFHNVKWKVFDSGVEGLYAPESLSNEVVKDGVDESLSEGSKVEATVPVVGSIKMNLKKKNNEASVILSDGYKCTLHE